MEHERIDRDSLLMQIAHLVANRGTCSRAQVGAALARDGRVLVTGYNGPPAGLPHCTDPGGCTAMDRLNATGCSRSVHAEANIVAYAARYGIATEGAVLYCTHLPCRNCAELIINSGITMVYYRIAYRGDEPKYNGGELLKNAGIDIIQLSS